MNWRLLNLSKNLSSTNMAIDEAILETKISGECSPTLRFYSWEKPTLSIGRNQSISGINLEKCKNLNIDIIRRKTGGKAVFHKNELTYSFIISNKEGVSNKVFDSYIDISQAFKIGLKKFDPKIKLSIENSKRSKEKLPEFCFDKSTVSDLNYLGKKLIGSAQLRKKNVLLQHGSILINQDFKELKEIFKKCDITNLINISEISDTKINKDVLIKSIVYGFETHFKINFKPSKLSELEINLAKNLEQKYYPIND